MSSLSGLEDCHFNANGNSVWAFLLEAEREALTQTIPDQPQYNNALIAIRVLGFLMNDLWDKARRWNLGHTAHSQMIKQINSIRRGEKEVWFDELVELGLMYRNRLFCVYHSMEPEPTPSRDNSPLSLDAIMEQTLQGMKDEPHNEHNIKRQALLRDGFKCAITGLYDYDVWEQLEPNARGDKRTSYTKAVYLFPVSTQAVPRESSASVFALLAMFGLESQAKSLSSDEVHSLQNVITLEMTFDMLFDRFHLWLEPVAGQEHTYDVCGLVTDSKVHWFTGPLPARIALRVDPLAKAKAAEQKLTLCLPDPSLIAIRAICARVSIRSGAAEQRGQIFRDLADSTVLAHDGSMVGLLAARLSMVSQ